MQGFGIGVAEFELDMLAVALDCFAADAEFSRDLTNTVSSRNQRKYSQLAIAEQAEALWKVAAAGKFSHRERSDCSTGVDLARQHSLNRAH